MGTLVKHREYKLKSYLTTLLEEGETSLQSGVVQIHTITSLIWCPNKTLSVSFKAIKALNETIANRSYNFQKSAVSVRMSQELKIHVVSAWSPPVLINMHIFLLLVKPLWEWTLHKTRIIATRWARTRSSTSLMWSTEKVQRTLKRCRTI